MIVEHVSSGGFLVWKKTAMATLGTDSDQYGCEKCFFGMMVDRAVGRINRQDYS